MGPPFFVRLFLEPESTLHADTLQLIALWEAEAARDLVLEEIAALQQAIDAADKAWVLAQADTQHVEQEREAKKAEEHAHNRRLHTYSKKRDETREIIDTGRASDYLVAERQFSSCAAIADQEETILLEIMEQLDTIEEKLQNAISVCELKEHRKLECTKTSDDQGPKLQETLSAATQTRDSARETTPKHLLGRYDKLRKKKLSCVASIVSGACSGCQMKITSVHLAEHKRGASTHHCQNCGRFLGALN